MSPTDAMMDAALEIWMDAVRDSGWGPVVVALGCGTAAALGLGAARTLPDGDPGRPGWTLAGVLLVALGVCALLRLDLLATLTVRALVQSEGWYDARRPVQFGLLLAVGIIVIQAFCGLLLVVVVAGLGRTIRSNNAWHDMVIVTIPATIFFVWPNFYT